MIQTVLLFFFLVSSAVSYATEKAMSNCPDGQHWVQAHIRKAYIRTDGTLVKATLVKAHCRENRKSDIFWKTKFKDKLPNDWPHKMEKPGHWTDEKKERVLEAFDDLPEVLWSSKIEGIYFGERSKDFPNPATSANKVIVLYDSAFSSKVNLTRILAHELAHQLYIDINREQRDGYRYASNWIAINKVKTLFLPRAEGFVQDDGRESPAEDFANNIEWYLFQPEQLKRITPQAYNWIRLQFGDSLKLKRSKK